jgi:hypothetical protein
MSEQPQLMEVFLDVLPNIPKNDQSRKSVRQLLQKQFDGILSSMVERLWDLPPIIVKPEGEYLALLTEARALYLAGHFYACVAMCGIVGERLVKDAFRASVLLQRAGPPQRPSDAALDQLERIEMSGIVHFLKEAELLSAEAAKAAESLGQLRNQYAHARGKTPQPDALKAIKLLHTLVEATVAVFTFEITDDGTIMTYK